MVEDEEEKVEVTIKYGMGWGQGSREEVEASQFHLNSQPTRGRCMSRFGRCSSSLGTSKAILSGTHSTNTTKTRRPLEHVIATNYVLLKLAAIHPLVSPRPQLPAEARYDDITEMTD